jgi:hypothetical protein
LVCSRADAAFVVSMVRGFALLCIRRYTEWWLGLFVFNQHKLGTVYL